MISLASPAITLTHTHSHSQSLAHSHSLTHTLTHSLTHSRTHAPRTRKLLHKYTYAHISILLFGSLSRLRMHVSHSPQLKHTHTLIAKPTHTLTLTLTNQLSHTLSLTHSPPFTSSQKLPQNKPTGYFAHQRKNLTHTHSLSLLSLSLSPSFRPRDLRVWVLRYHLGTLCIAETQVEI